MNKCEHAYSKVAYDPIRDKHWDSDYLCDINNKFCCWKDMKLCPEYYLVPPIDNKPRQVLTKDYLVKHKVIRY